MKHNITEKEELTKILEENDIVILDFYADWCLPCKRLSNHLPKIQHYFPSTVLVKANIDDCDDGFIQEYGVKTIPHVILFINKEQVYVGDSNHETLRSALQEHLGSS